MSDLSYSSGALDVLSKFHRTKFTIFVEGEDDVTFWDTVLTAFEIDNYTIEPTGSVTTLDEYINSILVDDVNIYIARDSDYHEILETKHNHERIIWTFGHSIENSLYHPRHLYKLIRNYSRTQSYKLDDIDNWINLFTSEFMELLIFDIASIHYKKGLKVMGDKCCQFMTEHNHHIPFKDVINRKLIEVKQHFNRGEYEEIKNRIVAVDKTTFYLIRGHFLTNAVINFVKKEVNRICGKTFTLSCENLFSELITAFELELKTNCSREDIQYLKYQISRCFN